MRNKIVWLIVFFSFLYQKGSTQEYSNESLKFGIGFGINEGQQETGVGTILSFGYQNSIWNDRVRINPNIMTGNFIPFGITDTRDQYYRITTIGMNGYLDLLKYKAFSIFVGTGAFVNYSRGLLGTGGWPEAGNTQSAYFFKMYYGGCLAGGIRINPKNSKLAYELTPFNIFFGNEYYFMGVLKFGIDLKLNQQNK